MIWETVPAGLVRKRPIRIKRAASRAWGDEPERIDLFGIPFASVTQGGLVDEIERLVETGGFHWVVTANIQHVGMASRDPSFLRTLRSADLVTADGKPICWAARIRRSPLPARVTGADLVVPLARRCEERGWRLMLMGGGAGVAEELAGRLHEQFPTLEIAGAVAPPLLSLDALLGDETEAALRRIRAAAPDVLLLALGTPKQELWIEHCLERLEVPVSIGVGAAFDFLVGRQKRAPRWMQQIGVEWLHRVLHEPRRLGPRYLRDGLTFARLTLRELSRPSS
jgi:N-acetylglucosaminyldiphosphoundecaprenol N-acetyl-beta-D-mannosaminyltransferase